jgi:hypothetical protein
MSKILGFVIFGKRSFIFKESDLLGYNYSDLLPYVSFSAGDLPLRRMLAIGSVLVVGLLGGFEITPWLLEYWLNGALGLCLD